MDKEFLEIVGNGKASGQCSKGDNCSFRNDMDKRAKMTQPNPSPNSFMQQECVENPKSQGGRRKYLRLQADQKLKQNLEDLLAHLQGLYIFVKEHGLMLEQELNSIKRTQWQKD